MKELELTKEELDEIKIKFKDWSKRMSELDILRHEMRIEAQTFWLEMKKKFPQVNGGFKFNEEKGIMYELSEEEVGKEREKQ